MKPKPDLAGLEPYLERLRALPFVRSVRLGPRLRIITHEGSVSFSFVTQNGGLGYAAVSALVARMTNTEKWMLFAPHIPPGIGRQLVDHGAQYMDSVGNCHVALSDRYVAHVEGRRPDKLPAGPRPLREPGLRVLLALLSEPSLLRAPVRELAARSGAGKSTAANILSQLHSTGMLRGDTDPIAVDTALWDAFAVGYAETLHPRWLYGRFRAKEKDPRELERRLADLLEDSKPWSWGGGTAADILINHYHGPETVLHLPAASDRLRDRLGLLRSDAGMIKLVTLPCPAAFIGAAPRTVAPVLVYAELLLLGDVRALETARMVRERYQVAS